MTKLERLIQDKAIKIVNYHGCLVGDCPCDDQGTCDKTVVTRSMREALSLDIVAEIPEVKTLIEFSERVVNGDLCDHRYCICHKEAATTLKPFAELEHKKVSNES